MGQKVDKWQLLLMSVIMVILVMSMLGISGLGELNSGSVVLAANALTTATGGSGGEIQPYGSTFSSDYKAQEANPAAKIGTLADTGIFGKVGIGTNSPAQQLHVVGNAVFQSTADPAGIILYRSSALRYILGVCSSPTYGTGFSIFTAPAVRGSAMTPRFTVDTSGRVGIGTKPDSGATLKTYSATGNAVHGNSDGSGTGAAGTSINGMGIYGTSTSNTGVYGRSNTGNGVYGTSVSGRAGYFDGYAVVTGDLSVYGTLTKGIDQFKIDHPLDPENKYLQHSVVESPDIKNIYDGNVLLDEKGEAVVELPSYFEALNRDFRYQLTAIGVPGPNLYIAGEIAGNQFKIAGGTSGMKVSWQVTGIRKDVYAKAHPIVVEPEKPANEKGLYMHPKEWGQPEEKGINQVLYK